jgi:simple sugar transport system ATP-binding protein
MEQSSSPLMELRRVSKFFGTVRALRDVSVIVNPGEVHCLLGDNGAGKSTLIKILSGVHRPDEGEILLDGAQVTFTSPRDALNRGIATVFQDLATLPLMSVARNFFVGREPTVGRTVLRRLDWRRMNRVAVDELANMGIEIRDPGQAVGTLSGGERQSLAIARAVYFGARVLILDEPTSALGVHQASVVLRLIARARNQGLGVVFITHNIQHAFPVGDRFTILNRGRSMGTFLKMKSAATRCRR